MVICDRLKMPDSFIDKLKQKWNEGKFVCVGLDSDYDKLPASIKTDSIGNSIFNFNKSIVDATFDLVCAYKINSAFYEAQTQTWEAMLNTFLYIQKTYPEIPVILDAKRADIGNTNQGYVKMAFETLKADAVTVHPYLGREALEPFFSQIDKGIIVLVRTSNPGSDELQNLEMNGKPLYLLVAENVAKNWNDNGNCAVVVGATYPQELKKVREIIGDMPILVPGIGAQGGDLEAVVKNGINSENQGIIISSSRNIIYANNGEDFAEAARRETKKLHDQIQEILKNV